MHDFESYRPLLFSIAYRMLGSVMEAEDAVQETYLRYQATPPESIRSPKSFLTTIVTRLCIDQLKSARVRRESYIGPWLPEPLLTSGPHALLAVEESVDRLESISMAFLVLLESLTPMERAVFLLHEVFGYSHAETGEIIGRNEATCRQIFHRAQQHVRERRPRFDVDRERHRQVIERFLEAATLGDVTRLTDLLAEDVVSWGDGGGKALAAPNAVRGRDAVARLVVGLARKGLAGSTIRIADVNGLPGMLAYTDGGLTAAVSFDVADGRITAIRAVVNPDKLAAAARATGAADTERDSGGSRG